MSLQKILKKKIGEFRSQNGFDTDNIRDYQSIFEYSLETLEKNKTLFENQEYEDLKNRIQTELNRINKFNQMYEEKLSGLKM